MKKFISLITAAAAVMTAVPMAVHAEEADERTYIPTIYFTTEAKDPAEALASGTLYVNTDAAKEDVITLPSQVLVKDQYKHVGQITVKWTWDTDYVYTSGIRNPSADGKLPAYEGYSITTDADGEKVDPVMVYDVAGEKMMGVDYSNTHINPLVPNGEASDSNPLGLFELNIAKNSPADYYSINFKTEQPYVTNLILRYASDNTFRSIRPNGENTPSLKLAVTDRALGDVNKDGTIDGRDATAILSDYALRSADKDGLFDKAQSIAADVNGNNIVDATDATKVLSYYAFTSSQSNDGSTLNQYIMKD